MRKLIMMALIAAMSTVTAMAKDDAVKSILKAKDYTEASNLLNSSLSTLTPAQKAKAYNKLVDLSLEKANKELNTINTNAVSAQLGQNKKDPVDTLGMYKALYTAFKDAMECDKYDQMPNEKGKVAPKFHKANQTRLLPLRVHFINAGQDAGNKNDSKGAFDYYGMYVESASAPLFADAEKANARDEYLGQVARVAAVFAFQNKNMDLANKYCDVALGDTASYKDALSLKMYLMQQTLKTKEDSLKCLTQFEELYKKDSKNEQIFNNLVNMYGNLNMKDKQLQLINEKIAQDPNNFTAWALKGQNEMNSNKWDEAIADFKKALSIDDKKVIILTYLGFSINSKAAALNVPAEQKKLYTESLGYLEKARNLDPDRKEANWSYPLYQCYYTLYGATDSRTKEIEALIK